MRAVLIRYIPKLVHIPAIRKVLAQGETYHCGLCKTSYADIGEAYACLSRCWEQFLTETPVVRRRARGGFVYRCRLCGKHYLEDKFAQACARACIARSNLIYDEELKMEELPAQAPSATISSRPDLAIKKLNKRFVSRWNFKRGLKDPVTPPDSPAAVLIQHQTATADSTTKGSTPPPAGAVADAPPAASASPPEAPRRKKADFKQAWQRDNAKYVCEVCHANYFTKVETTKCFDGHFDENGLEILKAS